MLPIAVVCQKNRCRERHSFVPTEFGKLEDTGQRLCSILTKVPYLLLFLLFVSDSYQLESQQENSRSIWAKSPLFPLLTWLFPLAVNSSSLLSEGKRSIRRPGLARSGVSSKGSLRLLSANGCSISPFIQPMPMAFWDAAMTVDWRTEAWVVYRWLGWFADTPRSRHQGSESAQNWQWRTVWKKIPPGGRTWNKWFPIIPGVREVHRTKSTAINGHLLMFSLCDQRRSKYDLKIGDELV